MRAEVLRALLEGRDFEYKGVKCICTGKYTYKVRGMELHISPEDTLTAVIAQFDAAAI